MEPKHVAENLEVGLVGLVEIGPEKAAGWSVDPDHLLVHVLVGAVASASRSFRTTCSGECLRPFVSVSSWLSIEPP